MNLDKQRVAAVACLEQLGFRWDGLNWTGPSASSDWSTADALHGILMDRAEKLAGCCEDSDEETELVRISEALDAYEQARWPHRNIRGKA